MKIVVSLDNGTIVEIDLSEPAIRMDMPVLGQTVSVDLEAPPEESPDDPSIAHIHLPLTVPVEG